MDRSMAAAELVAIAKELMAWIPMRNDVSISMRNKEMNESLTSYAPKIGAEMRKEAAMSLAGQGFQVDSRGELLKKEWSEWLTVVDAEANSNKYHYYVAYSFDAPEGTVYVAFNCSGRIGIIERAYDLTKKFLGGPASSLSQAKGAAMKHMATKIRKGYEPQTMVRG